MVGERVLDSLAQTRKNCELLETLKRGFFSHEMSEISWLIEEIRATQGLWRVELVIDLVN